MKVLKILLVIFVSLYFGDVGGKIEVNAISESCVMIEVETKDDITFVEMLLKVYNEIRYSFYRGLREIQVYRSKIAMPKNTINILEWMFIVFHSGYILV